MRSVFLTAFTAILLTAPAIRAAAQPAAPGAIAPPLSPRNANYTIAARLDPSTRTILGVETITWTNITSTAVADLPFHLYWNAWRDHQSTFMREASLGGGDKDRPASEMARIDVTGITLADHTDLTSQRRYIAPDDGNVDDKTVMLVPLPTAVPPGGSLTLEVRWTAHVPRTFDRTGAIGNYFFIAQWFPKLGVLEENGWNCHQFHATTEFFSDYGAYDVTLTVPQGWTVGATGVQRERRDNGDKTTTHRYHQDDVHDFAWTTSPDFVERIARFEHPTLPPVEMRLLLQPEHLGQADRHFDAARATLKYYGEWYGAYPYGHITIVDPAYQSDTGGMEYPTLFTAGTRWWIPLNVRGPEGVTVHEAGHQFWYGIVGNNEFENAWMDEGINTFSTARVFAERFEPNNYSLRLFGGFVPWAIKDIALRRETDSNGLSSYRPVARSDAESTPSYQYYPASAGGITYSKTALWLNTLERWLGWPVLQKSMSTFFNRWKFKHPKPDDFFSAVSETSGRDLTPFFDQVYRSSNVFDYGIQDLRATPAGGNRTRTTVIVRRYGEAIFPVDVYVKFQNGAVTEHWDGRDRWKAYVYERADGPISAEVDPNHVLLLDVNRTNNSRTFAPKGGEAATKWSMKWLVWLQDALLTYGFFV